ncbi:hypothetical protein SynBIOSU31_02065 [Synechococcus sp. BIOS-U3-1]|nr:hypothetical protein SynBIOSU31_02065 [Synechococcus sp. BIOS-U3-1]
MLAPCLLVVVEADVVCIFHTYPQKLGMDVIFGLSQQDTLLADFVDLHHFWSIQRDSPHQRNRGA